MQSISMFLERSLYNAANDGLSLDGKTFFMVTH